MARFKGFFEAIEPRRLVEVLRASSRRELAIGVALLIAAVGAFASPAVLGLDTPAVAAQAYLSGLAHADAGAVVAVSDVRTDLVGSANAALLDQSALKAALANRAARPSSIRVSDPIVDGNQASAQVSYRLADGTHHETLSLERVFPPFRLHGLWKVQIRPAFLSLHVPAAAGDLTVDGLAAHIPAAKSSSVAVLPGLHVLSTTGPDLIVGETVPYAAEAGSPTSPTIPLGLTKAGAAAAAKAVAAAFAGCSGQAAPGPAGCPQTYGGLDSPTLTWTLVGDPYRDVGEKVDPTTGDLQIFGHFQMIATADEGGGGIFHTPSSGGYSLQLKPVGSAFTFGAITSAAVPRVSRPTGATDQAMLDVVRTALTNCFPTPATNLPDCPPALPLNATNVSWSVQGDPMAGAAVTFDADADKFQVTGKVTLRIQYDPVLLGIALPHVDNLYEDRYTAQLFWDGQGPTLVSIL